MTRMVQLGLCVSCLFVRVHTAAADTRAYAIVVANNHSYDGKRAALRYADDDGVRYAELFGLVAAEVSLLSVLDGDTQARFPEMVARARPPSRAALLSELERVFARMRDDAAAGHRAVFYFVYSGHGEVTQEQEGYVHLLDATFSRGDLFEHVISASPAAVNHIIVDACNAYFLVAQRGTQASPAGDFAGLIRGLARRESLARYPNTGVVLATSSAAEVHEWGRIEAGVFSHELRSALTGAADANGDAAVDYDEAAAYIAAANGLLPDRRVRVDVLVRPPAQNLAEPLVHLPQRGARLVLPKAWGGRYSVEDDRGVRYADLNKTDEVEVRLVLVPRPHYYLRSVEGLAGVGRERRIEPVEEGTLIDLASAALDALPVALAARGSAHDAFDEYLFAVPFGPRFLAGFKQARLSDSHALVFDAAPPVVPALQRWSYGSLGVSVAAGASAVVFELLARSAAQSYRTSAGSGADLAALRERAESRHQASLVLGIVSAGATALAAGLYGATWLDD